MRLKYSFSAIISDVNLFLRLSVIIGAKKLFFSNNKMSFIHLTTRGDFAGENTCLSRCGYTIDEITRWC